MKIYWCLPISQITLNKKSRKTPEGINRLLYLVKLLLKRYQQLYYLSYLMVMTLLFGFAPSSDFTFPIEAAPNQT